MADFDKATLARKQSSREQRFPVVDLVVKEGMEAVIEFDLKEVGKYSFNKNPLKPISEEIRIPEDQLEYWANSLVLDPKTNSIERFYLSSKAEVVDSKLEFEFEHFATIGWFTIVHNADTKDCSSRFLIH